MAVPSSTSGKALSYWHRVRALGKLTLVPPTGRWAAAITVEPCSPLLLAEYFLTRQGLEEKLPSGVLLSLSGCARSTLKMWRI
jgi:hypothetical protein